MITRINFDERLLWILAIKKSTNYVGTARVKHDHDRGTVCLLLSFDLTCCLCYTSLLYVYTSLVTKDLVIKKSYSVFSLHMMLSIKNDWLFLGKVFIQTLKTQHVAFKNKPLGTI